MQKAHLKILLFPQDILTGASKVSLAGGTENMSAVPFVVRNIRFGVPLGVNVNFEDSLAASSLDTYCNFTMPQTAENLAEKYELKKSVVDDFALKSQQKWKVGKPLIKSLYLYSTLISYLSKVSTYIFERNSYHYRTLSSGAFELVDS